MVHSKNFYKNRESSFCLKKARRLEDLLKSLVKKWKWEWEGGGGIKLISWRKRFILFVTYDDDDDDLQISARQKELANKSKPFVSLKPFFKKNVWKQFE